MVNLYILYIGFDQSLNCHFVTPKTETEIPVEIFRWDGLQGRNQLFLGFFQYRADLTEGVSPVLFYKHRVVRLPVMVMMLIEGRQFACDYVFYRVGVREVPACQMREQIPDRPNAKEDRIAFLAR